MEIPIRNSRAELSKAGEPPAVTAEKIAAAARACFEKFGVKKTTIDDIAAEAGISRGSVYRYFSNKDDVLRYVNAAEMLRINKDIRGRLPGGLSFRETLTECLFLMTRIAHENKYIRMFIESIEFASKNANPSTEEFAANNLVWGSFLHEAMDRGEFSSDLSLTDVATWLILSEAMLLIKVDAASFGDAELRQFIARFVIMPIVHEDKEVAVTKTNASASAAARGRRGRRSS